MAVYKSQKKRLLQFLKERNSITAAEAIQRLAITRLASRIHDLKKDGYIFDSKMVIVLNRYGERCRVKRYYLKG